MYLKWHRWNIRSRPFSRTLVLGGVAGELEPIAAEVGYTQEWSSASRLGASRQTNIHTPIYSDGQFGVFNYPKTRVVLGMWEEAHASNLSTSRRRFHRDTLTQHLLTELLKHSPTLQITTRKIYSPL